MSNLEKFNHTIKEFEVEIEKLKYTSSAYEKLTNLTTAYDEISKQFDSNSKTLDQINALQKEQQEKVAKSLVDIESTNNKQKGELIKLLDEKTDQIRKENKEFYKEIETTIKLKLDDNKSQLKQLIEYERSKIKEFIEEELDKEQKVLINVIETETAIQTKQLLENQKTIKISLWIIGGLTLILSAMTVFKLWTN